MRRKLRQRKFPTFKPVLTDGTPRAGWNIHRIFNQANFDYGNNGGCQTAALYDCWEAVYKEDVSMQTMRGWYQKMDAFWEGKGEHLRRTMAYAEQFGLDTPDGVVRVVDIQEIKPKNITFDLLASAYGENDGLVVSLGSRKSAFFSPMTGIPNKAYSFVQYHVMRIAGIDNPHGIPEDDDMIFQNHWGEDWGRYGCGIADRSHFEQLRFSEAYTFNFENGNTRLG